MTDTERIDFLDRLNKLARYTGKCILRMSTTGRGWRLHETGDKNASPDVRTAIDEFIKESRL